MIYYIWYIIYDILYILYIICYIWYIIYYILYIIYIIYNILYIIYYILYVIYGILYFINGCHLKMAGQGFAKRWKKRSVMLSSFCTLWPTLRNAIQPRRKERSSAQCAAAGPSPALRRRARPQPVLCLAFTKQ